VNTQIAELFQKDRTVMMLHIVFLPNNCYFCGLIQGIMNENQIVISENVYNEGELEEKGTYAKIAGMVKLMWNYYNKK
jgi:coproporphyrinogen III oxidase-like Fe-S oxidoreductase